MPSKTFGNWGALKNLCNNLDKNIENQVDKTLDSKALEIREDLVSMIKNQSGGWSPLDEDTIKQKGHSKILIDTGKLVDSIDVQESGDKHIIAFMGNHSRGLSNSDLALIHEYGTDTIPSRPIVRPIYEKYEKEIPKEISNIVEIEIKKFK